MLLSGSGKDTSPPISISSTPSAKISSPEKLALISPGVCHFSLPVFVLLPGPSVTLLVRSSMAPYRMVKRVSFSLAYRRVRPACEYGVEVSAVFGAYGEV
jgi:hypothetical protein